MTVAELIEILKAADQNAKVMTSANGGFTQDELNESNLSAGLDNDFWISQE